VRVAAIDALAKLGTPEALDALASAARHADSEVQRAALAGIGLTRSPMLLAYLHEASRSADTATRLVAVSSLAAYDDAGALARVGEVALDDPEPSVKNAAIELLGESKSPRATTPLLSMLASAAHRARVVKALSRHVEPRASQLSAALAEASGEAAEALVTVLTSLPRASAEPALLAALELPNDGARRAAVRALRFNFDSETTSRALARAASQDTDPEVRRIAAARLS
jgi:HEAT repeat protein